MDIEPIEFASDNHDKGCSRGLISIKTIKPYIIFNPIEKII